ncbi:MAG TPA: MFS transporter [Gammaproteobacteria bacterium]|jgi:MFS family permease|nr:MFS transporter [Gammaproteobacteria bacterium]
MASDYRVTPLFITLIASIGMFLSTLGAGIANIAIPSFIQIFHAKLDVVIWTITLYTLTLSATIMFFGQLADRYGRVKVYRAGLLCFAMTSFLCGLSSDIYFLIVFRALQGCSAAIMQATAIAVITTRLEKEEIPKAVSTLGMLMGLGPMLGPVLGGFILSSIGWRWIFWLNIPICLYGLYGCQRLKSTDEILHSHRLNYLNLVLFGIAMLLLLLSMNYVVINGTVAASLFVATVIVFALHLYIELNAERPIINYHLFRKITFCAPILGVMAMGTATAVAFIVPPLFFEKIRLFASWQVGFISLSAPLGIVVASKISAKLSKIHSTDFSMLLGSVVMSVPLLVLTQMQISWLTISIFSLLFIYGLGAGFFMTSSLIHLTSQFPQQEQAFVASLIRMLQSAAVTIGAAGSAMFIGMRTEMLSVNFMSGIHHAWWLAAIATMSALVAMSYLFFE